MAWVLMTVTAWIMAWATSRRRRWLGHWQGNDQIASASQRRKPMSSARLVALLEALQQQLRLHANQTGPRASASASQKRPSVRARRRAGARAAGPLAPERSRWGVGRGARSRRAVGSGAAGAKLLIRRRAAAWDCWSAGWVGTRMPHGGWCHGRRKEAHYYCSGRS